MLRELSPATNKGYQGMRTETLEKVTCDSCGAECIPSGCSTGYGTDQTGKRNCFACCGKQDQEYMRTHDRITLYLTCEPALGYRDRAPSIGAGDSRRIRNTTGTVSNWPGSLSYRCYTTTGRHNIAGVRYDAWFTDCGGNKWHGVTYGENSQICHCRKLKG